MKNIKGILAGVLALAALMVSCVAEQNTTPEVDITTVRCTIPRIDVEEDFATGILDTLTATKATFSNGNFLWSAGDKIGIVPNTGAQIYFEVDNGAGTSTASFDGGDWAMKSTGTFYAYYPLYPDIFLSKDHVSVSYTGQTQSGNNNNLHTGDYWTLYTEGTTAVGNALNFSFNHLTSFFKTYVTVPAGTYTKITFSAPTEVFIKDGYFDLSAQTPTIVGTTMTDELCLDLQNVTFADETELTGYLVLAPVDITGIPITVTVYKDGNPAYEYTLTKTSPMAAAKTYAFRATSLTKVATSLSQANALFAAGGTSVTITEPLTENATIVLPNTSEAVTLILPTTASTATLTVSYPQNAASYPATVSITGPEGADLDIRTPNSTVTINGIAYDHVTSRTAANTCIIPADVTVNNLKVVQGGVQVYGTVTHIDLSEQLDNAIINVSGTVTSLLGEDDEEYAPATGVSLNQTSLELTIGETETLLATIAPVGAYPNIVWSSSDETIAMVSSTGIITAVAAGLATITATTISGGYIATCNLSVTPSSSNEPLTFTADGTAKIAFELINNSGYDDASPYYISLEYKINNSTWMDYSIGDVITLSDGDRVSFQAGASGNQTLYWEYDDSGYMFRTLQGKVAASGNIMSLLDQSLELKELQYPSCFYRLFAYSAITKAPALPATTLSYRCYERMFQNCSSLTKAPALPATTLTDGCYSYMFYECTSLTAAPELPATSVGRECYYHMFDGCSSLTSAPEILPATTLESNCYDSMFSGTKITRAPALPATTLANSCYSAMFMSTKISQAPLLPATTMARDCYRSMFQWCSRLTEAPELPAMSLAQDCYSSMFYYCSSLIEAPALPATVLKSGCYHLMFGQCKNLVNAPVLPATTLINNCYKQMFTGCENLVYIKMLATDITANDCLTNWVNDVSTTGSFVMNASATWYTKGVSGIPEGWTVTRGY